MDQIAARTNRENMRDRLKIESKVKECRQFLQTLIQEFKKIDPAIERIILFGSLAENTVRSEHFDIDIAVQSKHYLKLVSWCMDQQFKIDCIDLDSAPPHILERIEERGEILHEAKT